METSNVIESLAYGQICEILTSECHDLALSYESSKLIFACWAELAQPYACDLVVGVKSVVVTPFARSSGNLGSASRPWSRAQKARAQDTSHCPSEVNSSCTIGHQKGIQTGHEWCNLNLRSGM